MKRILIVAALVLVVLFVGGGLALTLLARSLEAQTQPWTTAKVERGELLVTVNATGALEPVQEVQVGSQVSGKVIEVRRKADARVKKGEVLALLDTELLDAERKDKESQLKHARIALEMLAVERSNLALREKDLTFTRQREQLSFERSQANRELAEKNLQRYQDLIKADATTPTELDIKQLEFKNADLDMRTHKVQLDQLAMEMEKIANERRSLDAREAQNKLAIDQAEQALAKAVTNVGFASIVSPIDGIVFERAVEPGQTIAAQFQTPNLFKIIADLAEMRVTSNIDEAEVGHIRKGMKVTFEVDSFRGEKFEGVVEAVQLKHVANSSLVMYPVIIAAKNPPSEEYPFGKLRPGMTAYVTYEVDRKQDILRVPASAVRFSPPRNMPVQPAVSALAMLTAKNSTDENAKKQPKGMAATVYTTSGKEGLKAISIYVGANDGTAYEMLSGDLKAGDELVTGRQFFGIPVPSEGTGE